MTAPLIVLLVALGLFVLLGFAVIVAGLMAGDGEVLAAGFALFVLATACVAVVAAVASDAPSCRLAPSSIVERAP